MSDVTPRTQCYGCIHRRSIPGNAHIACSKPSNSVKGDEYGIRNGWFFYPLNYDPTWMLTLCDNRETKA